MNLEDLRKHIDEIDERLFSLLQERLKLVEQVGRFKKNTAAGKYIIRPGREALKVKKAYQVAREAGYNEKISKAFASIWRELISLSINFEEEAKIAFSEKSPEMLYLLREYFGSYSEKLPYKNDDDALSALNNRAANIAAFAVQSKPTVEPWWLKLAGQTEFSIFAEVPLFPLTQPSTLNSHHFLISNVTPEPTGEDKFVYAASKIPADELESFKIISEFKGNYLLLSDEFYNNYQSKLNAKYLGCFATFSF